jgi:hypothetical protein
MAHASGRPEVGYPVKLNRHVGPRVDADHAMHVGGNLLAQQCGAARSSRCATETGSTRTRQTRSAPRAGCSRTSRAVHFESLITTCPLLCAFSVPFHKNCRHLDHLRGL